MSLMRAFATRRFFPPASRLLSVVIRKEALAIDNQKTQSVSFQCNVCERIFSSADALREHEQQHTTEPRGSRSTGGRSQYEYIPYHHPHEKYPL